MHWKILINGSHWSLKPRWKESPLAIGRSDACAMLIPDKDEGKPISGCLMFFCDSIKGEIEERGSERNAVRANLRRSEWGFYKGKLFSFFCLLFRRPFFVITWNLYNEQGLCFAVYSASSLWSFFFIRERGREGEGIGGGVCKKKIYRAKIGIFSKVGFKLVCFI